MPKMDQVDFEELMRQRMGQQQKPPNMSMPDPMWDQAEKFRQAYERGDIGEEEYDSLVATGNDIVNNRTELADADYYATRAMELAEPKMVSVDVGEPQMPGSVEGVEIGEPQMPMVTEPVNINLEYEQPKTGAAATAEEQILMAGRDEVARTMARERHLWQTSKMPSTFKDEAKALLDRIEANTANEHEAERYMELRQIMYENQTGPMMGRPAGGGVR